MCEGWLFAQVQASAQRLTSRPTSMLSPTGQILKADIEAWPVTPCARLSSSESRALRVVHQTGTPETSPGQQMPLITSVTSGAALPKKKR